MKLDIYNKLIEVIAKENVKTDEDMSRHTTFKIGGKADFFLRPTTESDLKNIIKVAKEYNMPITVIGNGSNVLVKDEGIRGFVIKPSFKYIKIQKDAVELHKDNSTVEVIAGAGVLIRKLSETMLRESIEGLEFAAFIPGCVGGEVKMNAGAHGKEMKDVVKESKYMDFDGNIHIITNKEHEFDYRKSFLSREQGIIIETTFNLKYGDKEQIARKMKEHAEFRKAKQPISMPCAGSTFKRGKDFITAKLIDECGLKGKSIGGAEVSTMHAGFIVNKGNATAKDVLDLVQYVEEEVLKQTGKKIELELEILG